MKKNSFRLSALTVSVLVSLGSSAFAGTPYSVHDTASLSTNPEGFYSGGGAVFIGGKDLTINNGNLSGINNQVHINTSTHGFKELVESSDPNASSTNPNIFNQTYLNENTQSMSDDSNYPLYEDYQRDVHGERLVNTTTTSGYSTPVGLVEGLKMGTKDERYQKLQSVTLYKRIPALDPSNNQPMFGPNGELLLEIEYQRDAQNRFVTDSNGNRIPVTVESVLDLNRNSDVYIKPVESIGGVFGLQDSEIYSQVLSVDGERVAAVAVDGNLQENATHDRSRDILAIRNTKIDNTLDVDAVSNGASNYDDGEEHRYTDRPDAVGLSINSSSVYYDEDGNGNHISGSERLTHQVAKEHNVVLHNAEIIAQNLAAVRVDDNYNHNTNSNTGAYNYYGDTGSTAVEVNGSGLFMSVENSKLTGGVHGAGLAMDIRGHANRIDVENSVLNGGIELNHDGYKPTINANVVRNDVGHYVVDSTGITNLNVLDREHNGTTLNLTDNTVVNGDIITSGRTGYSVQLTDVSKNNPLGIIPPNAAYPGTVDIYHGVVNNVNNTLLDNVNNEWTPVSVNLDHSILNGKVVGITNVDYPDLNNHPKDWVLSWNPDLSVTNGAIWNAAATAKGELVTSNVHDMNLSASSLNLVNLHTDTSTLGGRGRYEDLDAARVVVHGDLTQNKDSNGHYEKSVITVGKAVAEPLLNLGGNYTYGSLQVKGTAQGAYQLNIANSGVEPYVKNGYISDRNGDSLGGYVGDINQHSFVNYRGTGSDVYFTGRTELGVYQYDVQDIANDDVHDEHNVYFKNNGHLSNSAATALSMSAVRADIASMESDALSQHLDASRNAKDDGGVWISYFGGKNDNETSAGAGYQSSTNGVMLGVDNLFDAKNDGSWLAGLAFSSARSNVDVMRSSGDLDSYGAQFYLSRRFDNGVFVDTDAQFIHFSSSTRVHTLDGQRAHGDNSSNGYGLGMKLGYMWEYDNYFATPYVKASGHVFDGEHYTLDNGMVVNGDDFKSMVGEIGADVGYTFDLNQGYIKPYLHLAALDEFADSNEMKLNNVKMNNSIDGAAFRIGAGTEVKLMKDIGGYASFNYTKGDDVERPWQANVGINYSW